MLCSAALSFSVFMLIYILRFPEMALPAVSDSLSLCASQLIPALFPCMVLTELICSSGLAESVSRLLIPISDLLGLPRIGASALLLGAIGGFPNGAVATRRLYDGGSLTKFEAERLIAFSNNSGLAFCIGGVGASLYGNARLGFTLWLVQLGSALLLAAMTRSSCPKASEKATLPTPRLSLGMLLRLFSGAVTNASATMLKVCAFSVFFGVVGRMITDILPDLPTLAVISFCELTLAVRLAASEGRLGLAFTAFALGFGGFGIHSQIASVLADSRLSMRKLFAVKLLQGLISALITVIIC